MEPARFDRWTRRRFGLAAGGLVALLPGLGRMVEGDAKSGRNRKKPKPYTLYPELEMPHATPACPGRVRGWVL